MPSGRPSAGAESRPPRNLWRHAGILPLSDKIALGRIVRTSGRLYHAGNPPAGYPAVAGQNAAYTAKTLKDFRAGTRANDPNKMMRDIAARMTDQEIEAVAGYIQGLY